MLILWECAPTGAGRALNLLNPSDFGIFVTRNGFLVQLSKKTLFIRKKGYMFENRQIGVQLGHLQTTDGAKFIWRP